VLCARIVRRQDTLLSTAFSYCGGAPSPGLALPQAVSVSRLACPCPPAPAGYLQSQRVSCDARSPPVWDRATTLESSRGERSPGRHRGTALMPLHMVYTALLRSKTMFDVAPLVLDGWSVTAARGETWYNDHGAFPGEDVRKPLLIPSMRRRAYHRAIWPQLTLCEFFIPKRSEYCRRKRPSSLTDYGYA
jgi:hypothetical protein